MARTRKRMSRRRGRNKKAPHGYMLIVIGALGMIALLLGSGVIGGIYSGGWETSVTIASVTVDGEKFSSTNKPVDTRSWGAVSVVFDPDGNPPDPVNQQDWDGYGLPDLSISVTSPREHIINDFGEWVPAVGGQVFDSIEKKVGEDTLFYWDHHVFFFEIGITATGQIWDWFGNVDGECYQTHYHEVADFNIRILYTTEDWISSIFKTFNIGNVTATLNEGLVWSGIMSASVIENEAKVVGTELNTAGYAHADQDGLINMHYPDSDSTTTQITFYDGLATAPLANVPSEAELEVSGSISPGWEQQGSTFVAGAININWRLRVDVLTTAGYQLEDGNIDEDLAKGAHIADSTETFEDFFRAFGSPFAAIFGLDQAMGTLIGMLVIVGVIVLVILMVGRVFAARGSADRVYAQGPDGETRYVTQPPGTLSNMANAAREKVGDIRKRRKAGG